MADHPFKLLFFTLDGCGSCIAMKKAKTLERFVEKHSNVTLREVLLVDDEASTRQENKMADAYEVEATPTVIFEHAAYGEMAREEGGLNARMIEDLYEEACSHVDSEEKRAQYR